jgi:uncharacterized protein with FMN-binding domain
MDHETMSRQIRWIGLLLIFALLLSSCGRSSRPVIVMTEKQPVRSALPVETVAPSVLPTLPEPGPVKTSPYNEVTKNGKADGYGGLVEVSVGLVRDEIIRVDVRENESPEIGKPAIKRLVAEIVAHNSTDIDLVAGATISSNALLSAVKNALDPLSYPYIVSTAPGVSSKPTLDLSGASIGFGAVCNSFYEGDTIDTDHPITGFNAALAAVLFDADGRVIDVIFDVLEVTTPNDPTEGMPHFGGWPGRGGYVTAGAPAAGEEQVLFGDSEEEFLQSIADFRTKRDRGEKLTLASGTWAAEADLYEQALRGKTAEEVDEWFDTYFSVFSGRPLSAAAEYEDDLDRYQALTDQEKDALADLTAGATMSLDGSYGSLIGAFRKAAENKRPVAAAEAAKFGLGFSANGRISPEKDDEGVAIYSINIVFVVSLLDGDGKLADLFVDQLEIGTPNTSAEFWSDFSGWPKQGGYRVDHDGDGVIDGMTEDTYEFLSGEVELWQTKREKGDDYMLAGGSWAKQADQLQNALIGLDPDTLSDWVGKYTSNRDGRPLTAEASGAGDREKYAALSDAEKKMLADLTSGATISLSDARGNWIKAIRSSADKAGDLPLADD